MTQILVVGGRGYVGKAYADLMARRYKVLVHDPGQWCAVEPEQQARAALAIIAVPSPPKPDGSCDTSIVEEAIAALPPEIPLVLVKSTVTPGTTDRLRRIYRRPILFSPEYIGEGGYHVPPPFPHPTDPAGHGWMIVGGWPSDASRIIDLFLPVLGPATRFRIMTSTEAELVKYYENAWLALKVTFANEQRRVCETLGVNYHVVREGWLDDPRVGLSHSAAFASRPGFDGKCLPKDTAALSAYLREHNIPAPLLAAMIRANGGKP